eukprot:CAMPEP_0113421746 /NCGR_PEP_ID=MMETSP0013_2-20120614/28068_1 /TAXON_ID=2843 ORGANISM="Skeletonema costatum, Strain 1716" /NCGR_SAMPLE_ID=MMETSP0013_2 /ASSEMBLY_ACC=CAM_ASM_000158 /LENGTH=184 /DNA_ID=CAMNT_0000309397 /DNA_START=288 /DNA_END=842 /DNA_ORIENTATION=- /assembly_acc=CAM_ASM_000158
MAYLFSLCSVRNFLTQGGTTIDDGGDRGGCTSFNSLLLFLGALTLNPTPTIHLFLPPPRRYLLLRGRSSSALLVALVLTHSFKSVNSSSMYGTWSYFSLQLSRQKSITCQLRHIGSFTWPATFDLGSGGSSPSLAAFLVDPHFARVSPHNILRLLFRGSLAASCVRRQKLFVPPAGAVEVEAAM